MTIRFLHISDTHISAQADFNSYGHRPYDNLIQLITTINALSYPFDFVLHTGDVAQNGQPADYEQARALFSELHAPIYYLSGNHDRAPELQRVLLGIESPKERYDYTFTMGGVQVIALDTAGTTAPSGLLTDDQLAWLGSQCAATSAPLVIALHHEPLPLDVPWLDEITFMPAPMLLSNHEQFRQVIAPARDRIRGIFFGHIHRAFQAVQDGILYSSAPSTFGQLKHWPGAREANRAPEEAPGYCLVTVDERRTIIQQYTFERPT